MIMTQELTAEEIVTNLLASHEILKPQNNITPDTHKSLGMYLKHHSNNNISESENYLPAKYLKYTFIQDGKWHFS